MSGCPGSVRLAAYAGLELRGGEEGSLRDHLRACPGCRAELLAIEPLALLAAPRLTLPAPAWAEVMRAVRAEALAHPRRPRPAWPGWIEGVLRPRPLAAFALASALVALLALAVATTPAPEPRLARERAVPPGPVEAAAGLFPAGARPSRFAYRGGPEAEVTHVVVARSAASGTGSPPPGGPPPGLDAGSDDDPLIVTTVIDASLEELF